MKRILILTLIIGFCPNLWADSISISDSAESKRERNIRLAKGVGFLGIEYIGGPILAQNIWWQNGFNWDNPFNYVGEREPFLEDDAWHFATCAMFTEFHYRVLTHYFKSKHPIILSSALTFITWSGIECLDALDRKGGWLFSVNDEIANCLGIGFWVFKHYYPDVPLHVRVGMRQWGKLLDYAKKAIVAVEDYEQYKSDHLDNYGILKVEAIYKFYQDYYAGIAISKVSGASEDNLWGICFGYDFLKKLNGKKKGWWNQPVDLISRYIAVTIGFTFWID